jgi:hypothetical protein
MLVDIALRWRAEADPAAPVPMAWASLYKYE